MNIIQVYASTGTSKKISAAGKILKTRLITKRHGERGLWFLFFARMNPEDQGNWHNPKAESRYVSTVVSMRFGRYVVGPSPFHNDWRPGKVAVISCIQTTGKHKTALWLVMLDNRGCTMDNDENYPRDTRLVLWSYLHKVFKLPVLNIL